MTPIETAAAPLELLQATFAQIACPLDGHSLYATLEAAIQRAYELGLQRTAVRPVMPLHPVMVQAGNEAA